MNNRIYARCGLRVPVLLGASRFRFKIFLYDTRVEGWRRSGNALDHDSPLPISILKVPQPQSNGQESRGWDGEIRSSVD